MAAASSFTSTVPVPYVDATGCHIPAFEDILAAYQDDYRSVYGDDVSLDPDDQDGEWIGIQALAYSNVCAAFEAAYNAFSPATAQGIGLSSVVKVNGIARDVASYSTVDLTVVGTVGTVLTDIVASDGTYTWALPPSVIIPPAGQIDVTATCTTLGAIAAAPGTVTQIATPTRGLQFISNSDSASLGEAVESDPQLRGRQSNSTMLAATGVIDGIFGAIEAVPNVTRLRVYENDGPAPDSNGIPGHSISAVVDGGDTAAIARAIASRKLSAGTYGTASAIITTGAAGIPRTINFFRPIEPPVAWYVSVKALRGFTTDIATQIGVALSAYTNGLGIGAGALGRISIGRAFAPALLAGTSAASTFELLGITAARDGGNPSGVDIPIAYNEAPFCQPSYVIVTPVAST